MVKFSESYWLIRLGSVGSYFELNVMGITQFFSIIFDIVNGNSCSITFYNNKGQYFLN